ncbi:pyrroline-5-carboxylate reductase [Vagococcus intermedius]|uniref:Pyrroline-5-carboxylate reductase n=1 Tax=Vagococcus intermedius TaxID=2991418 RepID=A0AAF0I7X9_9ENTE|nr:pyrroline-5-carboxylate reductase [Vagococcus intermedius]WEG73755.1 pyrroline-5-carboxylate reductase [Vagococcus intermedius]WEG75840.1 pyrroline-5-carboxylate reductase [Vagococcus intermedius]
MKIGFIGSGNMATGIIKGLLKNEKVLAKDILITASTSQRSLAKAKELGVIGVKSNAELLALVDIVVLAVKPHHIPTILKELDSLLAKKKPLIISIAAGLTLGQLQENIKSDLKAKLVRVMPNMNVTIGRSVSAICSSESVSAAEVETVADLFRAVGSAYIIEEKDFRNFTSLAGCSPAYTYLYIDAMSRAGVKNGLPKELATKVAAEAVLGSAELLLQSVETPWDLIDKVCSPGGTTVAGLVTLEDEGFMSTVIKGLDATIKRDQELSN